MMKCRVSPKTKKRRKKSTKFQCLTFVTLAFVVVIHSFFCISGASAQISGSFECVRAPIQHITHRLYFSLFSKSLNTRNNLTWINAMMIKKGCKLLLPFMCVGIEDVIFVALRMNGNHSNILVYLFIIIIIID